MKKEILRDMQQAIENHNITNVKELIKRNDGILDEVTPFGTFLHDAVAEGFYDIAECLIENGIDINKNNNELNNNININKNKINPAFSSIATKKCRRTNFNKYGIII